jgi:hypothetical protein
MHWIAQTDLMKLVCACVLLALLVAGAPALAQEQPPRPDPPDVELDTPDIQIETTRTETVWYTDPVWIIVGIVVIGLIVLLVVAAGRGGGGTTVIRD